MRKSFERQYADVALKLLLEQKNESIINHSLLSGMKWDVLIDLAKENRILLRLYEGLVNLDVQPDEYFRNAVEAERKRIGRTIELMAKISKVFEAAGIDFVFIKNYQHYPDMGDDIDLFVLRQTNEADSVLISNFKARRCKSTLLHRVAGKTQYILDGWPIEVEIHHGRMGPMGEHTVFPKSMIANRRAVEIEGMKLWVPSPEDQFIIQVLQRVYGRFFLRISELIYAVNAISMERFDWHYIIETTKSIGIFDGLCYYLGYIGKIYRDVTSRSLSLTNTRFSISEIRNGLTFKDFCYRLSLRTIAGNLYTKKIWSDIRDLRWKAAGRTCLLPFFAVLNTGKSMINSLT